MGLRLKTADILSSENMPVNINIMKSVRFPGTLGMAYR